jgi:recombination protein RecA
MAPRRHKEGDFDQATIQMHRAKLVSALCSSMIEMIYRNNTAAVFINHKMESIEMTGRPGLPPKVTTPGGRGLKFYASLRLEFDVAGGIKDKIDETFSGEEENALIGNRVFVKCVKNKVGVPGRVVELRNRYGHGFDNTWSALQVLMSRKLVKKAGAWFTFPPELAGDEGKLQIHGEHNILLRADEDPEWGNAVVGLAQRVMAEAVETP